jgi:predicted GIY-YIG superfamily endonuclease
MNRDLTNVGWTVFFLECMDKTLYAGMTRNLEKELIEIRIFRKGVYFGKHPDRLPVTVVFKEMNLTFKEAHAKLKFMRKMNKTMKNRLIETKKWPIGGSLKKLIENGEI